MGKERLRNCFHKIIIVHFKIICLLGINFLQFLTFLHNFSGQNTVPIALSVFGRGPSVTVKGLMYHYRFTHNSIHSSLLLPYVHLSALLVNMQLSTPIYLLCF
jgi:hypothetical protein